MIKALRILALLVFGMMIVANQATAGIKFDVSKGAGKVTTTVSGWMETGKKQMDEAATLQTMIAMGKGAIETAKKMKQLADKTKGAINTAASAANTIKDEAQNSVGGVTGGAQDALGGAVGDTVGGVVAKTGDAQKLLGLKDEKSKLEAAQSDAIAAAQEGINSKIKLAQDNIAKLQTMISQEPAKKGEYESQIASYETQITNYNEELKTKDAEIKAQYKSQIDAVDAQLTDLRNEAASKAGDAAAKKLKSLLGGDDKDAQLMSAMIKSNFLDKDEEETSESILRIQTYRKQVAARDTVAAFNNAWKVKKARYANNEKAEEVQEGVPQMEGASASLSMDIQLKVENINALLEYTRMMVNDMKMRTANQLAELHNWKLSNYDKQPIEFNLDDYIFDKKSTKDKLLGLAKSIKENGLKGTAENLAGDALSQALPEAANKPATSTTTDNPLESVRSELRSVRAASGKYEGVDTAGPTYDAIPVNVDEELARARGGV